MLGNRMAGKVGLLFSIPQAATAWFRFVLSICCSPTIFNKDVFIKMT